MLLQGNTDQIQLHYPAFSELMRALEIRRGDNTLEIGRVPSNNYLFVPGDIVAVNPGTDDGVPSGDEWWRSTSHMNQIEIELGAMYFG